MADDLGPLPQSDDNARLQRESFKALGRVLAGQDVFVFRDERIEDFGADGSIELNIAGKMTNFRSHIQIKAKGKVEPTRKGYISFSIESSNLNYLLNGTCSMYLLWDANRDEFWQVWAQDEHQRLMSENPDWREEKSVTLHFANKFNPATFPAIQDRILKTGRMLRRIQDSLARATEDEQVVFRINPESLDVTDMGTVTSLLLTSGSVIVAAGYPKQVIDLLRVADPTITALPRMQLIRGYAEYMIGNHWEAISRIRRAMMKSNELSSQDNNFLQNLKDASEFHVGIIDSNTYEDRVQQRARNLTGLEALQAEQEAIYYRCVRTTDANERSELARQLRSVTERILSDPAAIPQSKLNAKLLLLFVEGVETNLQASKKQFAAEIRSKLFPDDLVSVIENLDERRRLHLQWEARATEALREAYQLNHPLLIFQALHVALRIQMGRIYEDRFEAIHKNKAFVLEPRRKAAIDRMLEEASVIVRASGSDESKLRLDQSRLDFFEVQGNYEAARSLANEMMPLASAMGFDSITRQAQEVIDGSTLLTRFQDQASEDEQSDTDVKRAKETDEELARFAGHFYETLPSPPARYEIVLEHLRVIRQMSRERVEWCRHLVMIEDLSKSKDPRIAYSELPSRLCVCEKFNWESVNESVDASRVISQFKETYCKSCGAREPKNPGSAI
ncbi:MAG: DUF4365 domain-containing protein [Acidobacteria bacterium]|nr:DUF4365 domain-containing protein [Acidobacteriota bacterium]